MLFTIDDNTYKCNNICHIFLDCLATYAHEVFHIQTAIFVKMILPSLEKGFRILNSLILKTDSPKGSATEPRNRAKIYNMKDKYRTLPLWCLLRFLGQENYRTPWLRRRDPLTRNRWPQISSPKFLGQGLEAYIGPWWHTQWHFESAPGNRCSCDGGSWNHTRYCQNT